MYVRVRTTTRKAYVLYDPGEKIRLSCPDLTNKEVHIQLGPNRQETDIHIVWSQWKERLFSPGHTGHMPVYVFGTFLRTFPTTQKTYVLYDRGRMRRFVSFSTARAYRTYVFCVVGNVRKKVPNT